MINNSKNFKRPQTQPADTLKTRLATKLPQQQMQKAKQNPLFVVLSVLAFTFVIMILFLLKTTLSSGSSDPVKPTNLILKSQTEYLDDAEAALLKKDYPTFAQIAGASCIDFKKKSDIKDINLPSSKGVPLIVTAASVGDADAVQLLICENADVNAPNVFTGDTAVMLAAHRGDIENTLVLVRAGADLTAKNKYNQTPLLFGVDSGDRNIINILVSSGAVQGSSDVNLLFYVNKQNVLGVESMLKTGAKANAKSDKGWPALASAALLGNPDIANLLLLYNANLEAAGPDGSTPLLNAAKYKHAPMVQFLLSKGASVNVQNNFNESPLFWAAFNNTPEIADMLINAGADATVTNRDGYTPAKVAQIKENKEVIEVFKKHNISPSGKVSAPKTTKKTAKK